MGPGAPLCWVLHRWGTKRHLLPQGTGTPSRGRETADGYRQTGEVWGDAETLFGNVAGSHLSGPTAPGAQARARGEEKLSGSQEDGFRSWIINPADVTATPGCLPADSFLPFQLFFTLTWERVWGRDVLRSWPLWQECRGDTWPGRVFLTHVFSHGGHLYSPLPLVLRNQELQMFMNRMGQGRRGSQQCVRKAVSMSGESVFLLFFFCLQMTKPSADRRVKLLIFHPLRIWPCEDSQKGHLGTSVTSFPHQACKPWQPRRPPHCRRVEIMLRGGSREGTSGAAADYGE